MAVDRTVLEAGSSILEALDRFYKLLWVFDLQYNDKVATFMLYMQTIYGMNYGTIPSTVTQLQSIVAKFKFNHKNLCRRGWYGSRHVFSCIFSVC